MALKKPQEWVPIAKALAKDNGGILQHGGWLRRNGYGGLVIAMRNYPELFSGITQHSKRGKSLKEWLIFAEKLAEDNDGLPGNGWLTNNGYSGLAAVIRANKKLFANIKRKSSNNKTPQEWLIVAEKLAKNNGGTLQHEAWLRATGYTGLPCIMRRNPELFANIKQDSKQGKPPEERVREAEELAYSNEGVLPGNGWLKDNGRNGIYRALCRHPKLFDHIEQAKYGNSPLEWVPIAEKLAKDNGGLLPRYAWLRENGYCSLAGIVRTNSLFDHIKQEYDGGKSLSEWLPIAEHLASDNDGVLPANAWLKLNGFSGLCDFLYTSPESFEHIERCRVSGPTSEISQQWLKSLGIKHLELEYKISIGDNWVFADGYDVETNTVYEFHGDYWHGNPSIYAPDRIHGHKKSGDRKMTMLEVKQQSDTRDQLYLDNGFNLVVMWEADYRKEIS